MTLQIEQLAVRTTSYSWCIEGSVAVGDTHKLVFRLPNDADIISVYMQRKDANSDRILMNILDDGVSIMQPYIPEGLKEHLFTTTPINPILAGSIISLSSESGFASDLVVQLDLEETIDDLTGTERA